MSAAEIWAELPELTEAEHRAVRQKLSELAVAAVCMAILRASCDAAALPLQVSIVVG